MYGFSLGIKYQVKSELTVFPLCPLTHLVHSTVTKKTEQTPKPKPTSDYWWFFTSSTKLELQKDASKHTENTGLFLGETLLFGLHGATHSNSSYTSCRLGLCVGMKFNQEVSPAPLSCCNTILNDL